MEWNGRVDYWSGVLECHAHKWAISCRARVATTFVFNVTSLSWHSRRLAKLRESLFRQSAYIALVARNTANSCQL